jgi:hypothetical protein
MEKMGGKVPKVGAPENNTYTYRTLCHGKFGRENSIYDRKWGAHTLDIFSPFVLFFDFYFLDFYVQHKHCGNAALST